ncbi:MAG: sortase [Bacilli bacterium]|nr:sortase [Bacilli bacterium]
MADIRDFNPQTSTDVLNFIYSPLLDIEKDRNQGAKKSESSKKSNDSSLKDSKREDIKRAREETKKRYEEAKEAERQKELAKKEEERILRAKHDAMVREAKEQVKRRAQEAKEEARRKVLEEKVKARQQADLERAKAKEAERLRAEEEKAKIKKMKAQETKLRELAAEKQRLLAEEEKARIRKQKVQELREKELEAERKRILAEEEKAKLREQKAQEKRLKKLEAEKKKAYKVTKSKESSYKKKASKKSNFKVFAKPLLWFLLIASITGYTIKKTGVADDIVNEVKQMYADYEDFELKLQAQNNSEVIVDNGRKQERPAPTLIETILDLPDVIIEEDEYESIITDYYDADEYSFDETITPEYLKSLNPALSDNLAWLCIPGTNINYPVALPSLDKIDDVEGIRSSIDSSGKPEEQYMNEYYLHHNLGGTENIKGTIYMDVQNDGLNNHFDIVDDNTVIYGHNMKDGSMFHDIAQWKNDSDKLPRYGIIYTDDGYGYMVHFIASRVISGKDSQLLHPGDFENPQEKVEYVQGIIDEARENNWYSLDGFVPNENDKYISLVTCVYDFDNARIQLIGKISGKIKVREHADDENGYYVEDNSFALHR